MARKKSESKIEKIPESVIVTRGTRIRQSPDDNSAVVIDVSAGAKLVIGSERSTKDYISVELPMKIFGNPITGFIRKDCVKAKEVY